MMAIAAVTTMAIEAVTIMTPVILFPAARSATIADSPGVTASLIGDVTTPEDIDRILGPILGAKGLMRLFPGGLV